MASPMADRQVRISRIGGRYLAFDIEDVVYIRRHHGICAILMGTMPQNPTQNIFLGLPIELYAEEARLLIDKKVAYIADEATEHLSQLKTMDPTARSAYLQSLKMQRKTAQLGLEDAKAKSKAQYQRRAQTITASSSDNPNRTKPASSGREDSLFDSQPQQPAPVAKLALPAVTPTTSNVLVASGGSSVSIQVPASYPLYRFLNTRGYYITPGLRFGGDYSVYPGDPFRFHAHYMANSYGWDEKVPMLDLVTSGRLGTAVKKSFLFGSQQPATAIAAESANPGEDVRVFCIEWAGM
ncbi:hypothetical protein B0H67DRAFT_553562 [Lasiosphaeris hirsuta]|uniref:tRNA-splicing endonuclease subunit Sen34 n=1 Tax=Lasiosphaeris hirsuta TaxID=260670 RepID=A0AA40AFL5_9PEZI|nr:hypothetical protein B0H67DRAFT_553562 [Lasiosphaeris hirsuta]